MSLSNNYFSSDLSGKHIHFVGSMTEFFCKMTFFNENKNSKLRLINSSASVYN